MTNPYERCRSALEAAIDSLCYDRATRPSGFDWECHRDRFLNFDPDDDAAVDATARLALKKWDVLMAAAHNPSNAFGEYDRHGYPSNFAFND